ncbi:unnamed protein product [Ranitomeya imitator]|uniref:Uncharacterized protein n=1 Tax=Ranitomeya imitator TaxID=111125 RepID=A0ABN9LFJ7_9NEOB|nr:unnamed protein product [Ranitomeya imitator]
MHSKSETAPSKREPWQHLKGLPQTSLHKPLCLADPTHGPEIKQGRLGYIQGWTVLVDHCFTAPGTTRESSAAVDKANADWQQHSQCSLCLCPLPGVDSTAQFNACNQGKHRDIVPVYQIKGISKLVKLCLPKVQCFCDSPTSPPSERQISAGLTKLSSELFIYQKHFDWLKKAAHVARHLDHEFTSIHNRIEKLVKKIDFLMTKMNIARASDPPLPQLPNTTTQWGVVQTGHAIFHHFHLFLDYTTRVVVLMKNKL